MFLDVAVLSPSQVLFRGRATSVILPGEEGVFELAPFHKRLISRLLSGILVIDDRKFTVKRGVAKVSHNKVTILIEEV